MPIELMAAATLGGLATGILAERWRLMRWHRSIARSTARSLRMVHEDAVGGRDVIVKARLQQLAEEFERTGGTD